MFKKDKDKNKTKGDDWTPSDDYTEYKRIESMRYDINGNPHINTEISPDLFLTMAKINFDKAAKGFEHLSAWCTAALYMFKMPDKLLSDNDFIANFTADDYNKLAAVSLILENEEELNKAVNDIITAMESLKLVTSMNLNKGDNNGKE